MRRPVRWRHVDDRARICHRHATVQKLMLLVAFAACSTSRSEQPRTSSELYTDLIEQIRTKARYANAK
jgi:hypothetical protein